MINKLAIIGIGLMGGSLIKALRQNNQVKHIIGFGRSEESLIKAQKMGVIDEWTLNLATAVKETDIIVIATPIGAFRSIFLSIKPYLSAKTIIIDVGSVKHYVLTLAQECLGAKAKQFIPTHPIAGKENSGIEAADAMLFNNKKVILTPTKNNHPQDIKTIETLWQATGAIVNIMDAKTHDEILASTSHLPHILAFALIDYLSSQDNSYQYAAGGFKDFSRIASSNSVMWRDICLSNKTEIIKSIQAYQTHLEQLKNLIQDEQKMNFMSCLRLLKHNAITG